MPRYDQTATFRELLHGTAGRCGLSADEITDAWAAQCARYLSDAARAVFEFADWPPLVNVEERTVTAGVIPWSESGKAAIGQPLQIWRSDPRLSNASNAIPVENCGIIQGGVQLFGTNAGLATAWVRYRLVTPEFNAADWDAATAYAEGEVAYQTDDGNCYQALGATTGNEPPNATYWIVQNLPRWLREPVEEGACAAMTREDGQAGVAQVIAAAMEDWIAHEMGKFTYQSGRMRQPNAKQLA